MAYTGAGQLIEAWDYNRLTWGGNATGTYTSTPSNLAYVWGVGNGTFGYGQDALAMTVVAAGEVVTAAQWSTFIQRLNLALAHQSGAGAQLASGSNIGVTAGATIQYFANVATAVGTVNTNAALFAAQGSTTTGTTNSINPSSSNAKLQFIADTRCIFGSADRARLFFNAGGQINMVFTATSNTNNSRSNNIAAMVNQVGGFTAFRNTTNSGRTGTGGTITVNNTNIGYRSLTVSQNFITNTTGAPYGTDYVTVTVIPENADTTNGAICRDLNFRLEVFSAADTGFNDATNITVTTRLDIVFPSTTYLSNQWGTPSVTFAWTPV